MRSDVAQADRFEEIRAAARAWKDAGVIDDSALGAISALYPDDRVRLGPVFRALLFVFTLAMAYAAIGLLSILIFPVALYGGVSVAMAARYLVAGVLLGVATEVLTGPGRRRQWGVEAATSLASIVWLLSGCAIVLFDAHVDVDPTGTTLAAIAALLFAAAAWRWGYAVYGAAAGVGFLLLVARLSRFGRLLWIVIPLVLLAPLLRGADSGRLSPGHRRSLLAAVVVLVAALYAAVNIWSLDRGVVESIGKFGRSTPAWPGFLRVLAIGATALVPLGLLVVALRRRHTTLLRLAVALGVASLATLRAYIHVAPPWAILVVGGGAAIAAALAIRRSLASGADGERLGFTADPLFGGDGRERLYELGAAAALAQAPASSPEGAPAFRGRGGEYGGGGASGEF